MLMTERERVLMCQAVDPEIAQQIKVVSVLPGAADEQYEVLNGLLYKKYKGRSLFVMLKSMRKSLVVTAHDLSGTLR